MERSLNLYIHLCMHARNLAVLSRSLSLSLSCSGVCVCVATFMLRIIFVNMM